ncbi:MAG: hypothetical protein A3H69_04545 [Candidatus Sungbacteria bacterium RIFCSPLOWO2_02_FULL_47_9]|uniref:Glutamyl-tRNA amidotransferase n=1 Tax=Candidatus Sungbacteria bacterium RIFCSPHIGHO2_01_FULL_47_32 TaxID=1802264 RepID=A0A1G2K758_9BACT|nr:MAG: hypothetical protein UX72_C0001G0083 [Parcubacteria group bacterium GW2011_GWA2_47_10]OGZ95266.1 MAG: hypothetical protein A2633_06095 [Candidatus Sungbacteria bacterium RIFCSPHIGHO2_01_FULL_47_32]OGZ97996.1 MAG: hypothetical protein A3D57_02655 [Candidatus Sungbacteria bacterium RIFCSPHIGHO2_02_FULL_46_12]OHA06231.1 MAG: hypothetical protein A3A28_00160 [Candidatus Sungbacteria bacterium RIFCSPLOWO2_01_FULL_47_32]OHA11398.1 MAG: hypothetical protein A3H69_04545 [Candidatus Sungbacteria
MPLKQKIEAELKSAMKNKEELRLSVLRMLKTAIGNKEVEKRTKLSKTGTGDLEKESQLTDEEIMEVLRAESKKRKDAVAGYKQGGRTEMAEKEKREMEILQSYLPAEISESELNILVEEAVKATGAQTPKEFGRVMGYVMGKAKNRVSGDRVSEAVKAVLGK